MRRNKAIPISFLVSKTSYLNVVTFSEHWETKSFHTCLRFEFFKCRICLQQVLFLCISIPQYGILRVCSQKALYRKRWNSKQKRHKLCWSDWQNETLLCSLNILIITSQLSNAWVLGNANLSCLFSLCKGVPSKNIGNSKKHSIFGFNFIGLRYFQSTSKEALNSYSLKKSSGRYLNILALQS